MILSGRNIGDEFRYVLERRNQKKFPGNMLARPTLLLNPWVVRSTESGEQTAKSGEDYDMKESGQAAQTVPPPVLARRPPSVPWRRRR